MPAQLKSHFAMAFRQKIAEGGLKHDAGQVVVARALDKLSMSLADSSLNHGLLGRILRKNAPPPKGLYIWGEVGRGKTMLMDLFFAHAPVEKKRRIHFHAFMQEIHRARAALKSVPDIASEIARDSQLLCLDEMQIVDIADAMIIERLYDGLQEAGVVLVTTANIPPDGLYKDGLNRQNILPFIEKLKNGLDVISLDSAKDYRLGRMKARETFLSPASAENRVAFNEIWRDLTDGAQGQAEKLEVLGRTLTVPKAAHACASFTFFELCGEALGPPDYLAIARAYTTVFISGIPKLKAHQRNEMKRFILMIDTFYDAGTRVVALADGAAETLFAKNQHSFESQRTISRLKEMQSASWWGATIIET
jgi:cell division protein ZapE